MKLFNLRRLKIRRSVFFKLLVMYLGIAFCVVLCLNFLLTWFFRDYFYRRCQDNLLAAVDQVQQLTGQYSRRELSGLDWVRGLSIIERSFSVHLAIVDGQNRLIVNAGKEFAGWLNLAAMRNVFQMVRAGRTVSVTVRNTQDPLIEIVLVGAPLPGLAGNGVVVAYAPVADLKGPLQEALQMVWLASLLVLACATPVLYLLSRHFTRPLQKMHAAALKIAGGDFHQTLNLRRRDEIGELAEALSEMARRLAKIEEARQDLLANVSHELRTPLTSVRGFVQGMLDGTIPEKDYPDYLSRVYAETQRLSRIVADLLDIARLRAGRLDFRREAVPLAEVCREALDCFSLLAKEKGVRLTPVFTEEFAQASVSGDRGRLLQVLINLLDNALRFTPPGGEVALQGEVVPKGDSALPDEIALKSKVAGGDGAVLEGEAELEGEAAGGLAGGEGRNRGEARISIVDEGPGIPEEEIPYIFERFYQGSAAEEFPGGGTGLGLAISKLLVEAHGGRIALENRRPEKGSVFSVYLPLSAPPASAPASPGG
ncbi:MAG: HAMP domain-containing histidine kinase [Armatimonadetes bacterium]|nr:HAMP domain-containing histidine kinase [Armatimonadota bacterium]